MFDFLYTIFIFPIELIIELFYIFILRIFRDPAISVLGVSFTVSILTLPLYFMAEKIQNFERDMQKKLKPDVDNIKSVFNGDERFMRLSTYYRQNNYHPFYSLRSSISLIIQIPFFIAAYHFLSNLEMIKNVPLGPIYDLSSPDSLLKFNSFSINILPIAMTIINFLSAMIYTKGFAFKDKVQLYGIAAIFLVLLYNSPAGLVLYWTGNNFFSLVKNIIQKTKYPKQIALILVSFLCLLLVFYLLVFHEGWIINRIFLTFLIICVPLFPFSSKILCWIKFKLFALVRKIKHAKFITTIIINAFSFLLIFYVIFINDGAIVKRIIFSIMVVFSTLVLFFLNKKFKFSLFSLKKDENISYTGVFILSLVILFLLAGIVIPSSLISSSVQEFSLLENYKSPFSIIGYTILQSFGLVILWPLCIYFLFSYKTKKTFAKLTFIIMIIALVNTFIFVGNYGYLSITFLFSRVLLTGLFNSFFNIFILIIFVLIGFYILKLNKKIMVSVLTICILSFLFYSIINFNKIHNEFQTYLSILTGNRRISSINLPTDDKTYKISRTGENVLIIMLDRGISGYLPYIFEENPELYNSFDGFTYYKNTVSFSHSTLIGSPPLYGGYEYTPLEMNSREQISLVEKQNEALLLLPRIFIDNGYEVTFTEPTFANYSWIPDLSIFLDYPQVHAENIVGKYTDTWINMERNSENILLQEPSDNIKSLMLRFSFFRFSPLIFRKSIYDNGRWLSTKRMIPYNFPKYLLDLYVALDVLPDITDIIESTPGTLTIIHNDLTHDFYYYYFSKDFIIFDELIYKGDSPFADEPHYHVNRSALLLLGKYFDYLKINDVYDNTRIIIVSDHSYSVNIHENITLPDGGKLQSYNALLLVKDFNSKGFLSTDMSFMTNADVPLIALKDVVENPVNPWTGKIINSNKENGVIITNADGNILDHQHRYTFNIQSNQWLHVHTNIFDQENWSQVTR